MRADLPSEKHHNSTGDDCKSTTEAFPRMGPRSIWKACACAAGTLLCIQGIVIGRCHFIVGQSVSIFVAPNAKNFKKCLQKCMLHVRIALFDSKVMLTAGKEV